MSENEMLGLTFLTKCQKETSVSLGSLKNDAWFIVMMLLFTVTRTYRVASNKMRFLIIYLAKIGLDYLHM